jgi:probable DNA metabolism protein
VKRAYRYDGSFEGFLCATARSLADGAAFPDFLADTEETGLFQFRALDVETDFAQAADFCKLFKKAVSVEGYTILVYAFHGGFQEKERALWEFIRIGLERGKVVCSMLADERVSRVVLAARSVSREVHRYKGFIRFRETAEGFLYAAIEPEADVIPFLVSHFVRRIGDRPWMIHDLRHSVAALYDLNRWRLVRDIRLEKPPVFSDKEHRAAGLWRQYFRSLAIEERYNAKLQQKHVPTRFRKYLPEFDREEYPA